MPAAMEGVEDDEKKSSSDDAQPVSAYKLVGGWWMRCVCRIRCGSSRGVPVDL